MIGFININKPSGITSFDVIRRLKKILNYSHIGHLGTLDPLASGVLPIAVGKATRLFDYFLSKDKVYLGEFEIGIETDSQDITGEIVGRSEKRFSEEELQKILPKFIGEIDQIPPKFSAKKLMEKGLINWQNRKKILKLCQKRSKFMPFRHKSPFVIIYFASKSIAVRVHILERLDMIFVRAWEQFVQ